MHNTTLINGEFSATLAVTDRGLLFGDGFFTTARVHRESVHSGNVHCDNVHSDSACSDSVYSDTLLDWPLHLQRIRESCTRLFLDLPDEALLLDEAQRFVAALRARGESNDFILRLTVTRGSGGRGYAPPASASSTRIWTSRPLPADNAERASSGVRVRVCSTRLGDQPLLAGLKHLNRLEQVLARHEWTDAAVAEGLMLDQRGCVIEGTMSNLFWRRRDGTWCTPDLSRAGVAGIQRAKLIAHLGDALLVGEFPLADLLAAEEIFLCNSVMGIWPVIAVDDQAFPMGTGTRALQRSLFAQVHS